MKVAPVSADLLIKLALLGVVVVGGVYLVRRASSAIGDALPDLPDVGAWVDRAGQFAGDVGDTVGGGATWVADTFGGTAHTTNPADFAPSVWLQNPYGIYLSPEQQKVHDATVEQGTTIGNLWDWVVKLGNQVPAPTYSPDPRQDIRRIDNALGY